MKKIILLLFIVNCLSLGLINCYAQYGNNYWQFGYNNNTPPYGKANFSINSSGLSFLDTVYYNNINLSGTNANIANDENNLLFYSNGYTIVNKNQQKMENGDTLSPSFTTLNTLTSGMLSAQFNLYLKIDSFRYYVFHQATNLFNNNNYSQPFNLQYSIVDLSYNNGLGKVINKNTVCLSDTLKNGGLTFCRHANGRDWWLPIKKWHVNKFSMLLITPQGIQNTGEQTIGDTTSLTVDWSGQTAFSPDGNWYATIDGWSDLNIYSFDRCSGTFTNSFHVVLNDTVAQCGLAFSPNSKYLYFTRYLKLYQIDLLGANFPNNKQIVATYDGYIDNGGFTTFLYCQLMPDGKIYINTKFGTTKFHIIQNPDSAGTASGVCQHCFGLNRRNLNTVPNHYNYTLGAVAGSVCDSLGLSVGSPTLPLPKGEGIGMRVSPNPANQSFYINYKLSGEKPYPLTITNTLGAVVYSGYAYPWFTYQYIDCSTWPNGVYVAQIKTNDGRYIGSTKVAVIR
jgi:hypothetical protein